MPGFSLQAVTIRRNGVVVLDSVTVEIGVGVCTAVVGASGAGNTTLRLRHTYWVMSDRSLDAAIDPWVRGRAPRRRGGSGPVDLRVAASDQHGNRE